MIEKDNDQPESDQQPAPAKKKKPAPRRTKAARQRRMILFFMQLVVVVVLVLAAGGFYLWKEQQDHFSLSQRSFSQLRGNVDDIEQQQQQQRQQLAEQLNTLQEQQTNLDEAFSSLLKTSSHLRNDWLLTEAEYLIKLANHRLLLEKDINTAVVALQAADERLREVSDPALLKIRKRIAEDINQLRAVPQPDLSGMSFSLSALANDVTQLPLATPDPDSMAKRASEKQKTKVESWRDLPAAMWQDLKSLVVIRHHDQPLQPLLSPEQRFFLTQNLQLQLEQARLALLKGHRKVFQERLQQADEWLNTYFDRDDDLTQHVVKQLQVLAQKNIDPEMPDISETYQVLRDFRAGITEDKTQNKPSDTSDKPKEDTPTEDSKAIRSQPQDDTAP